jgi:FtsH-binding integral membrane protein
MSYSTDEYYGESAANAPASERVKFIRRTYLHVAGAGVAFVAASAAIIASGLNEKLLKDVFLASKFSWVILMVVFIGGTYAAEYMAQARKSVGTQYAGLALFVALYTLLFVPILTIASTPKFGGSPHLPIQAGIVTLTVFAGLTVAVFLSGKDFSGLGPILCVASFVAFGVILAAALFGFSLGIVFLGLMVALFAGYIIYDTSNIIHRYGTDEHVAASMSLFGSAAMLFYYILRIFMATRND